MIPSSAKISWTRQRWSTATLAGVCVLLGVSGFVLGQVFGARSGSKSTAPTSVPEATSVSPTGVKPGDGGESVRDAVAVVAHSWDARWAEAHRKPNTPARNRELCALVEELARTNPDRALELARSMSDWRVRDLLRNAAVRGWAETAPDDAARWSLTVGADERRSVVEALMQGAVHQPDAAVRVALQLAESDPERGGDYGQYAIAALSDVGAFTEAVRLGAESAAKHPFLLKSASFQWGRNQPEQALAALEQITDPVLRGNARSEAIAGWAWADAPAVVYYAQSLVSSDARREILAEALPLWIERDPTAAAEWISRADAGEETDAGVAAIANLQALIRSQPVVALGMASEIVSPSERSRTMRAVFRQWAEQDRAAAARHVENLAEPADRAALEEELKDLSPDG
jgi:hypothetical protein